MNTRALPALLVGGILAALAGGAALAEDAPGSRDQAAAPVLDCGDAPIATASLTPDGAGGEHRQPGDAARRFVAALDLPVDEASAEGSYVDESGRPSSTATSTHRTAFRGRGNSRVAAIVIAERAGRGWLITHAQACGQYVATDGEPIAGPGEITTEGDG